MKTVAEILNQAKVKGDFGIEIECEGKGLLLIEDDDWRTEKDGSLRGNFPDECAEYVLNNPIPYGRVKPALEQLANALNDAKLDFSYRTSVHIHVNVQGLTEPQLQNYLYAYLILEPLLVNYCGKERVNNRFCLRYQDAEGNYDALMGIFTQGVASLRNHREENVRYAALNIGAITKYGSLEFRSMRGTLDPDVLLPWIDALHNLKQYAMAKNDVTEIYEDFNAHSYEGFVQLLLGDVAEVFYYPAAKKEMDLMFSLTIDFPYMYKMYVEKQRREEEMIKKLKEKGNKKAENILPPIPDFLRAAMDQEIQNEAQRVRRAAIVDNDF